MPKKYDIPGGSTGELTTVDFIIGMPPITTVTDDGIHTQRSSEALQNAMPIAVIYPGIPTFASGIDLFNREDAFFPGKTYAKSGKNPSLYYLPLLEDHKYTLNRNIHNGGVKVAYIADNFPTDTFSNEYGENFLQKFTDVASEGAASIAQMFGARSVTELASGMTDAMIKGGGFGEQIGNVAKKAGGYIQDLGNLFASYSPAGARMASMIGSLAAGSRIDFPMVWKSSAFQPSYTMTIRLYNPNPGSLQSTKKYIIGPIAALMLLGIPISRDSSTYSWPYLHRVWSPGIYDLDPAYIQNITIIKGGDQQQISHRQSLAIVDVRIDFGSLFSSMLATKDPSKKTRPTLQNYLKAMEVQGEKGVYNITGGSLQNPPKKTPINTRAQQSRGTIQAPTQATSVLDANTPTTPQDRINQKIKSITDEIINLIPKGFRISTD